MQTAENIVIARETNKNVISFDFSFLVSFNQSLKK